MKKKSIHCPYCGGTAVLRDTSNVYVDELQNKRIRAHQTFDQIWKNGIHMKKNAYRWMHDIFCLTEQQAHIGCFSEYMCDPLIEESRKVLLNYSKKGSVRCG